MLDSLLQLDPAKRATASQALEHPYFREIPWPAKKFDLPKYQSMHEIDIKKMTPRNSPVKPGHVQSTWENRQHRLPDSHKRLHPNTESGILPKHRL